MPLEKQPFAVQLGQGVDTKTDPKQVVPGRLLELENGVFDKLGQIRKRNGYSAVTRAIVGGTAVERADGIAAFRDELLLFGDSGRVYSRSESLDGWVDRGGIVSVDLSEDQIVRNTYQQSNPDSATSGGLTLTAWEDSRGGVRYSVREDATGAVLVSDAQVSATGSYPRVVVWQSEFAIFYSTANNLFYRRVPVASPTNLGVEVNPVSTLYGTTPLWDVIAGASYLFVVGNNNSANLGRWLIDSTWTMTGHVTLSSSPSAGGVTAWVATNGSDVLVLNATSTTLDIGVLSVSGTVLVSPSALITASGISNITGVSISNTEGAIFFWGGAASSSFRYYISGSTFTYASTGGAVVRGLKPCTRAFVRNGAAYCGMTWSSSLQSVCMVQDERGVVVAKTQPGSGGGHRTNLTVASVHESSGVFSFPATVTTGIDQDFGAFRTRTGVERVTVDFTSSYRYATAELGANLLIAGGILHAYDGQTICESGFHFFPEGLTGSAAGSGGSIDAGAHQYRVVYEWTDAQGQIHRSAPSNAYSVTTAANDRVTLTVPTLRVTQKTGVRILVYRTVASGSVFYRISSLSSPLLNSTSADSVSYVDSASDASIASNELIYTDGTNNQELENIPPGACALLTTHRSRAFVLTGRNRISYSKLTLDGQPPAFNDGLYIQPDGRGGDVTAFAGMDDKLVVFKERAIFAVAGDGPNNAGQGDYAKPQLITSDVGCDEPRSVVLTNAGLMFHSPKGIYLLDRSLTVTYIGAPVELYNSLTITSAAVVPSNNQVRFTTSGTVTLDNGETRTDIVLVYDYLMNQWSTFTGIAAVDATVWNGVYVWTKSTGRTYKEAAGTYTDDGAFIRLRMVTSWLSLGQLQGFQRVYRILILGDYKGAHSLRVRLGYDFAPEYTYDQSITPTAPGTWGSDPAWGSGATWGGPYPIDWFRVSPARQKCSAIRISVEDVQTSAFNEGIALSGILLIAGVKSGPNRMSSSRSI